jgi:cobalt-zinc-cadmium efflux system protein
VSASHSHDRPADQRLLAIALGITVALLIAEVIGGILTGSLALIADGGHMASDAGALGLSLGAVWLATRPATKGRTYGFARAEIIAAFVNSLTLVLIAGFVFWQAAGRFSDPPEVESLPMLGVAAAGLVVNLIAMSLLNKRRQHSLNVRSAFLHVLGDTLGSVGVIVAGVIMLATNEYIVDPIVSVIIGVLILISSFRIITETTQVLLEATPPGIRTSDVQEKLMAVPGVRSIHDLHIWTVTSGFISLSAHVETGTERSHHDVLVDLRLALSRTFDINHATLQLETASLHEELESCCGVDTEEFTTAHAAHHS